MFSFARKKIKHKPDFRISLIKIIAIFLVGPICAGVLITTAVYNGVSEFTIKNAIERSFDLVSIKTEMEFSDIVRVLDKESFKNVVQNMSSDDMTLYPVIDNYPEDIRVANNDLSLSFDQLQASEQELKGGIFEQQGRTYIWNLVSIEDQLYTVLSVNEFNENENNNELSIFTRRLIIPGIFVLLLTAWGSLALLRLLIKLFEHGAEQEKFISIDSLTGLQNQKHASKVIEMHLSKAHRENKHLPVLLVLIENYCALTEDYGASFSDAMVLTISQRLNDALRVYDQKFRYRDNVFMVLLPDETLESSALVEKRLNKELGRQYEIYGHCIQPKLAFEVVVYPDHIHQMDEFVRECSTRIDNRLKAGLSDESVFMAKSQA